MTVNNIIQALHDRGAVAWQLDLDLPNCEVLSLIDPKGRESIVKILLDETKGVLLLSHWLTESINIAQNPKMATLLYVALAAANDSIVQAGNIGLCQMDISEGCLLFSYVAVLPLGNDAKTIADLILLTLPAIALVEPFFDHVEKRANDNDLSVDDVFSCQSEVVVDVHPFLKVPPDAKSVLGTWMGTSGFNSQYLMGLFQSSSTLQIFYVLTDISISFYASNGRENVKIGESGIPTNTDDKTSFTLFAEECWNIYTALAAMLNIPLSNDYLNCDDFLSEIDGAVF